jgi:hypothetical protein
MPREPLPPDPQSQERWQALPHNQPSKHALPPATGGAQAWLKWLLILSILAAVIALLSRGIG